MRASKRGFTLAEMLVYIGVLAIFTTAIYSVFGLSSKQFKVSEARSDSLQAGLQSASAINRVLAGGVSNTLQVNALAVTGPPTSTPANKAMMFLSADPVGGGPFSINNSTGEVRYQKWTCVYWSSEARAILQSYSELPAVGDADNKPTDLTVASTPGRTFPFMINGALSGISPALNRRMLARNVNDFTVTLVDGKTAAYSLTTLVLPSVSTRTTQTANLGVTTTGYFKLRN